MSDIYTSHDGASHGSYKSYATGLALSIVLTLISFGVVMAGNFSIPVVVVTVVVTAVIQVLVQLALFMHLNTKSEGGWNVISFVFTISILVLIIGGSLWIMYNIHVNMMLGQSSQMALKPYFTLTKPGIIFGNLFTVIGGYFLATNDCCLEPWLFLATVLGTSLVVASGCVFNNVIDRDIDGYMARTRFRAMVTGKISIPIALLFGGALGLIGFGLLAWMTTPLATGFAAFGFVIYVGAYSLYFKRHSVYSTLIGSFSGASPPVIGYCAVIGKFDLGALLLLIIFSMWQIPHSYAIAIFRFDDYVSASIPVLPVKCGIAMAKRHIVVYMALFVISSVMLSVAGYTGWIYAIVTIVVGLYWLGTTLKGYRTANDQIWARKVFGISILVVTAISVMMSVDSRLPMNESVVSFTLH